MGNIDSGSFRPCLFCLNRASSEEHIISEWLAPILKGKSKANSHLFGSTKLLLPEGESGFARFEDRTRMKTGPAHTRRPKVVCAQCNNGWMSNIETQVMSAATFLIQNDAMILTPQAQGHLARWAILKAIVVEQTQPHDQQILTPVNRQPVKFMNEDLANWGVWIARIERRGCLEVDCASLPLGGEGGDVVGGFFTASFVLDHLFVHVRHADPARLSRSGPFVDWLPELVAIHPPTHAGINLRETRAISADARRSIVTEVPRFMGVRPLGGVTHLQLVPQREALLTPTGLSR